MIVPGSQSAGVRVLDHHSLKPPEVISANSSEQARAVERCEPTRNDAACPVASIARMSRQPH